MNQTLYGSDRIRVHQVGPPGCSARHRPSAPEHCSSQPDQGPGYSSAGADSHRESAPSVSTARQTRRSQASPRPPNPSRQEHAHLVEIDPADAHAAAHAGVAEAVQEPKRRPQSTGLNRATQPDFARAHTGQHGQVGVRPGCGRPRYSDSRGIITAPSESRSQV